MPPHFTATKPDEIKDIECAICLEPWDHPAELQPCRHVFCSKCCERLDKCPDCRTKIAGRKPPNRILVNIADSVEMRCEGCSWVGTREASRSHTQCLPTPPPAPAVAVHQHHTQPQQSVPQRHHQQPQPVMAAPVPAPHRHQGGAPAGPWSQYGLTQEEYDHIMMVFITFDNDDSGELDRSEISVLARWLNYAHGDRDIDALFREMDTDRSGSLSMDEFCRWVSTHRPDPTALYGLTKEAYETTLFAFHTADRDSNGLLNKAEFAGLAQRQGWASSPDAAARVFAEIDTDRSGDLDLDEILRFRHRQAHGNALPPNAHHAPANPQYGAGPSAPSPLWQSHQHQHQHVPQPQQPPMQASSSKHQPPPMMLDGTVVSAQAPSLRNVQTYVSVAPIATAPQLFRTRPQAAPAPVWEEGFSVPVYPVGPDDSAVFRLFDATNNIELGGATVRLDSVPPSTTAPQDVWIQLHSRDPTQFDATNCRVRVRMSLVRSS